MAKSLLVVDQITIKSVPAFLLSDVVGGLSGRRPFDKDHEGGPSRYLLSGQRPFDKDHEGGPSRYLVSGRRPFNKDHEGGPSRYLVFGPEAL